LKIQATKEQTIKAHPSKDGGHFPGMAKGINLPANMWLPTLAKSIIQLPERQLKLHLEHRYIEPTHHKQISNYIKFQHV
jgi:hypothetical protein